MYFIEIIAQKFYMQLLSFKNFSFIRCVVIIWEFLQKWNAQELQEWKVIL